MEENNLQQPLKQNTTDTNKSVNFYDLYGKKTGVTAKDQNAQSNPTDVVVDQAKELLQKDLQNEAKNELENELEDTLTSVEKTKIPTEQIPNNPTSKPKTEVQRQPTVVQEETTLRSLRTYKDDLAQAMTERKSSVVSIATAENERRVKGRDFIRKNIPEQKHYLKKIGIVILSTVLVVLGAGSALYFYGKSEIETVVPKAKVASIVFADEEENFEITGLSRRQILNELNVIKDRTQLIKGRVKNVFITGSLVDEQGLEKRFLVSTKDFLNAIDTHASASFLRSLNKNFMVGVHAFDGSQPFLILKTSFYENAFAGMLEWERYMQDDLAPLFGSAEVAVSGEQVGTSTPLAPLTFSDAVIKNQDTRVLKDRNGEIVLIYSFIDQQTIVITTNANTLNEILIRLKSSKSK